MPPNPQLPPWPTAQGWTGIWEAPASDSLSLASQATRLGWKQIGKLSPRPREIIRPDKTSHKTRQGKTRPDTDKDLSLQTQASHRPTYYTEPRISASRPQAQASQRTGSYSNPGITENQMLPQNVGVTEPDIVYTTPGDIESGAWEEMVKLGF